MLLVRQLLTESALLALMGGALGLLLAIWIINLVVAFKPPLDVPVSIGLHVDWRVLIFSLLVSLITVVPTVNSTWLPSMATSSIRHGSDLLPEPFT